MDGIWYRGILCVVCVYHLLEYVCTLCHFTDDGDGNSADRAYHKDESGDGVWNLGCIGLGWMCVCVHGLNQILIFAFAFVFMMIIPGYYLNGKARKAMV